MPFDILAIVGPTAAGKTALALEVARSLASQGISAEIVNADAMQLYSHMDIGTAKLSLEERSEFPHHLFDSITPEQEMSAVQYKSIARKTIDEILTRGAVPIVVGGSMFYLAAALDELEFAPTNPLIRARLEQEADSLGETALHDRLEKLDPLTASRIPSQNIRRVIRALEVIEITGAPYQSQLPEPKSYRPTLWIGVSVEREELKARIAQRVGLMWESGLIDEARQLREKFVLSRTAAVAIGYQQAFDQLDGKLSSAQAMQETSNLTSRYARRQMSWFRRDSRIRWCPELGNRLEFVVEQIRLER